MGDPVIEIDAKGHMVITVFLPPDSSGKQYIASITEIQRNKTVSSEKNITETRLNICELCASFANSAVDIFLTQRTQRFPQRTQNNPANPVNLAKIVVQTKRIAKTIPNVLTKYFYLSFFPFGVLFKSTHIVDHSVLQYKL